MKDEKRHPTPSTVLGITSRRVGDRVVVEVAGELDLHESSRFSAEVDKVLTDAVELLEICAERLTFADSAGLRAILMAQETAQARGIGFELSNVPGSIMRVIDMAGLNEVLLPREHQND